ncbi:methyltransferase [Actinomadura graeca]|uniref:Methyltransferase n=1 Tax=Actinomadura graeca TaxID=2750812 RepID=A0ABX8R0W3_9ACTN|nr:acetylserotonin O-methyltransferase [Actinomadura graeca]QXJ24704.1 methyltransferase [Actinomadura graeca]
MPEQRPQAAVPDGAWGDAELRRRADLTLPMAIRVAATVRLADHIADGGSTAGELAGRVGADPDALERLLRHLAAGGVLAREGTGRYRLTPHARTLRDDHPQSVRAVLDMEGALGRAELTFVELLHSIRTGQAAYATRYGRTIWRDLEDSPDLATGFDAFMSSRMLTCLPAIVRAYDWSSLGRVVDVGGGDGRLLAALLTGFPLLRGTLVERPGPASTARATLAGTGADVTEADFFGPLPAGGGGYLLANVLHNWDDESCRRILGRCREAAGDTGRVIVIEHLRADDSVPGTALDLRMLVLFGGSQRSLPQMADLAAATGLGVHQAHPAGEMTILDLRHAAGP